jgi:hypothetical protein
MSWALQDKDVKGRSAEVDAEYEVECDDDDDAE